jgi:hypothetical protein
VTISGHWTGSVHFHDLDAWSPHCEPTATAVFTQGPPVYGSPVSASVHNNCVDAEFQGSLRDDGALVGEMTVRAGSLHGAASGTFYWHSLYLDVPVFQAADTSQVGGFSITMHR